MTYFFSAALYSILSNAIGNPAMMLLFLLIPYTLLVRTTPQSKNWHIVVINFEGIMISSAFTILITLNYKLYNYIAFYASSRDGDLIGSLELLLFSFLDGFNKLFASAIYPYYLLLFEGQTDPTYLCQATRTY